MKNIKKRLTALLAIVCVLTLLVGSLAYFTDRVLADADFETASASEVIDVTTTDPTDPDPDTPDPDPGKNLEKIWEKKNPDMDGPARPGDSYDLGYTLTNVGSSAIDVRETIVITCPENMDTTNPEWRMFLARVQDEFDAWEGDGVVEVESRTANKITYSVAPFVLEKGASIDKVYYLVFDKYAKNAFQGDTCTVEYLVEMRQHLDSVAVGDGWNDTTNLLTATTNFGGDAAHKTVPAA